MKHDTRYKQVGHRRRALSRYYMILNRVNNTQRQRNKNYAGVEILFTKNEFIEWFMEHDYEGCSVDRIDALGNYCMNNIQMIPLAENIRKDKVKAVDGMCECYRCKEVKPLEVFTKDKRRQNGHSTCCKSCDNKRKTGTS